MYEAHTLTLRGWKSVFTHFEGVEVVLQGRVAAVAPAHEGGHQGRGAAQPTQQQEEALEGRAPGGSLHCTHLQLEMGLSVCKGSFQLGRVSLS